MNLHFTTCVTPVLSVYLPRRRAYADQTVFHLEADGVLWREFHSTTGTSAAFPKAGKFTIRAALKAARIQAEQEAKP